MLKRKKIREKGKIPLSKYFQNLKIGDKVTIVRNLSVSASFPKRIQGLTGTILGKQGRAYIVEIKQGKKAKKFIIEPLHLKKIKTT